LSLDSDGTNGAFSFEGGDYTVHQLKRVHKWLAELPILIPSATARPNLVERFFPGLEVVSTPAPALPYQTVHQRLGSFGKSAMTKKKVADLVTEVRLIAATGKTMLVIVHQQNEAAFKNIPGVSTMHHGDVEGDDDFGHVDVVLQIGGPLTRSLLRSPIGNG
jgi:hypothetical protein